MDFGKSRVSKSLSLSMAVDEFQRLLREADADSVRLSTYVTRIIRERWAAQDAQETTPIWKAK